MPLMAVVAIRDAMADSEHHLVSASNMGAPLLGYEMSAIEQQQQFPAGEETRFSHPCKFP